MPKPSRPAAFAFTLVLAMAPSLAHGWATVYGDCATTQPIASAQQIVTLEATLSKAILLVGQNLDETVKQGQAAQDKQFEHLEAHLTTLFKQHFLATQAREDMRDRDVSAAIPEECKEKQVDMFTSQLNETTERLRKGLAGVYKAYSKANDRNSATYSAASALEMDKVDFFPEGGVLTDEELKALTEAASVMADPVPSLPLTDKDKDSQVGIEYMASENKRELYLETVRNAFGRRQAMLASKITDPKVIQALNELYSLYGNGTSAPQIRNGEISQFGFLELNSNLRYASPNWRDQIRDSPSLRLQREQTLMQALQLKLQWETLQEQQMQTMLLAQMQADAVAKEKQTVNPFYQGRLKALNP
jgi:hypothetical protein